VGELEGDFSDVIDRMRRGFVFSTLEWRVSSATHPAFNLLDLTRRNECLHRRVDLLS
jgi:hypothetical protein